MLTFTHKGSCTIRDSIKHYASHKPAKAIDLYMRNRWAIDTWPDSVRADCLADIGKSYFFLPNIDSARHFLSTSLSVYSHLNDLSHVALVYRYLGNVEFAVANYLLSAEHYHRAMMQCEALSDTALLISSLYSMSLPLRKLGRYEEAINYLSRAEMLSLTSSFKKELGNIFNQKGVIYRDWKRDEEALRSFSRAIDQYTKERNQFGLATSLVNQANCYRSKKKYEQALKNHHWALSIYEKMGMKKHCCKVNTNIGMVYMDQNKLHTALTYFDVALKLALEVADTYNVFVNHQNKGLVYLKLGQHAQAETSFIEALSIGEKGGYKSDMLELYLELSEFYTTTLQPKQAVMYLERYKAMRAEFINESIEDRISHYEVQFKTIEKESEIQRLSFERAQQDLIIQSERRKKMVTVVIALLLIFAGIGSAVLYRNRQRRRSAELSMKKAEIENRLLRVQMNPHFMFNSLNSVQSYIASNQSERAEDFLSRFAMLTRMILNHSREDFVSLSEEVATIKVYLELEQQRFNNVFTFSISVDEQIDEDYIRVPPMLVQPFVENAILHGVAPLKKDGIIQVRYELHSEQSVLCVVEDNGIGREASSRINRGGKHRSLGLQVTQDRLTLIQQQTGIALTLKTIDLMDNQGVPRGTRVEMVIPCKGPEKLLD